MARDQGVRLGRRRVLQGGLALAGLGLVVGCGQVSLPWQRPGKVYRVGILGESASDTTEARLHQALGLGLQERGWIEGENLLTEFRWTEGNAARIPDLAADLVRLPVDLILARSSIYTQGAKAATSSIPIVFITHADPVGTGHVESLAHPGGNATGQTVLQTELGSKHLDLLMAVVPTAMRIAVLWHSDTPSAIPGLRALEEPARALGLQLQPIGVRAAAELEGAFAAMAHEGAQAVLLLATPFFRTEGHRWVELALAHRLPTIYSNRDPVAAGALMSYGPNVDSLYRSVAVYVDKILKGAKPADLPVEQATTFDFIINLKTARALGLTIPPSVLQQATEIIQ
jgi:putative tryptophan/tyrosine transport system substrate-binding protein